jgi:hypothetical protein
MSSSKLALGLALACLVGYGGTLRNSEFFHDDQVIIADNPLLHQGLRGIPKLCVSGYWEAVQGDSAPVQEYRPVLMISFLLQAWATGFSAVFFHALNLLLHWLCCLALWGIFQTRMEPEAAAAGALIFALMPVHTEAVSMITGRSEVLSAVLMLSAWLCLEASPEPQRSKAIARQWAAVALYGGALLTKESSLLFPVLLALSDWVFHKKTPWGLERRTLQTALWSTSAAYLILRALILSSTIHGGVPYFDSGRLIAALTVSRFMARHYLVSSLTGTGLCTDYSRPLITDSALCSWDSWLCLLSLCGILGFSAYAAIRRRSQWGFWVLGSLLFLLPTSHMIFALDTLGAERFLYMPTLGLAAGLGHLYSWSRSQSRSAALTFLAALLGWYGFSTAVRNLEWGSRLDFYEAAVDCNPVSAKSRSALGASLLMKGKIPEGKAQLLRAMELGPRLPSPYYNLAKLSWEEKKLPQAESLLHQALSLDPKAPDSWVLLALVIEAQGRPVEALSCLEKAIGIWPWYSLAEFNLGRLTMAQGKIQEARRHFSRFLELSPDTPNAAEIQHLIIALGNQ